MKTFCECITCFRTGASNFADRLGMPPDLKKEAMQKVSAMIDGADFSQPPPFIAERVYAIITDVHSGGRDAFRKEKDLSTRCALELLAGLEQEKQLFKDPFDAWLRLAISGNIIDFGVDSNFDLGTAHAKIMAAFKTAPDIHAEELLRKKMNQAKNILYILDNCGEAVFDAKFIELFHDKITAAVRGRPILNDVTRTETQASGLTDAAARIIDTGDSTPGISLERSSNEFVAAFNSADLIVAKGQGNFETLNTTDRPAFFLFRAKCPVVMRELGNVAPGSPQIRYVNIAD